VIYITCKHAENFVATYASIYKETSYEIVIKHKYLQWFNLTIQKSSFVDVRNFVFLERSKMSKATINMHSKARYVCMKIYHKAGFKP